MKKIIQSAIAIAGGCLLLAILSDALQATSNATTAQDQAAAVQTQEFLNNLNLIASH